MEVGTEAPRLESRAGGGGDEAPRCTPIMGIDVWEHSFYLKARAGVLCLCVFGVEPAAPACGALPQSAPDCKRRPPPLPALPQYGPEKPKYVDAIWTVINWRQVSENYDAAARGDYGAIGAKF